ncbi:elongation factor 4 [Candidatus Wolfebacteria bacterium]|nr:MAG: elongation factor 4 [Candidatus Wolfebacteria bacterium]
MNNIRNFTIIAHIDHGKSTLADRMIEVTNTVEARKMKDQVLDNMELERERGITIKMQPVRMAWTPSHSEAPNNKSQTTNNSKYILNLIDTPGHIDFSYEVSRALKAVEGSLLLVDSTQGVQAQTLTTLAMARDAGLVIIPVVTKTDMPHARTDEIKGEIATLLDVDVSTVLTVSGKTGDGVPELLDAIIDRIPAPKPVDAVSEFRSMVFDFQYSNHRGVVVYIRVLDGSIKKGDNLIFKVSGKTFSALEVGIFAPDEKPVETLGAGEIGYIVTGIKSPGVARVGDTVASLKDTLKPYGGYEDPKPVVWASVYPESQDDFTPLKQALARLKLSDSSLSFEEETSGALGRGFRCGLLGMLHLEIVTERLRREFDLELIVTTPSITYVVEDRQGKKKTVYSPIMFPDDGSVVKVFEPWVTLTIITPHAYTGAIMQNLYEHEGEVIHSEIFGETRTSYTVNMPLRELMRNFFDEMKSISQGFASLSYEIGDMKEADVVRLDLLVAEELVPAFSRIVSKRRVDIEGKEAVEKLYKILPRQMIVTKIQARSQGRIISSKTLSAMKKDVTAHLYGGDITRKMKLREKQKKGKKKMQARGKVNIPHSVFMKMMRGGE